MIKNRFLCSLFLFSLTALYGSPLIIENFEDSAPGDGVTKFPGIQSNYGEATIQVESETEGEELFAPGNTRYLNWESLSGINPDESGFNGGPSDFISFQSEAAAVVTVGFDFIIEENHGELLFGIGQEQTDRADDQHFGPRIVIRGDLGIHGVPEITTTKPGDPGDQGLHNNVPYRIEAVANQSGGPVEYMSPIGPMTVENERFDLFLMNLDTGVYQLIFDDSPWHASPMAMNGVFWATYPYESTGRAVDVKLDNITVYENEIALTGYETVPAGPSSAFIDFEEVDPERVSERIEPLWYLPGQLVEEPENDKTFGAKNRYYFDTNGASLADSWTDEFRFQEDLDLLSVAFDVYLDRKDTINGFSDGHDEVFLAFSGGDTRANATFTSIVKIRGTRSVGNDGNPAEAEPSLLITGKENANRGFGFDWRTPYRIQVLFNQSGDTVSYASPWDDELVSLGNEMVHMYLYNYDTGDVVPGEDDSPIYLAGEFNQGISNNEGVRGTLYDCLWKSVTGRRLDLRLDNMVVFENSLSVLNPDRESIQKSEVVELNMTPVMRSEYQLSSIQKLDIEFKSDKFSPYSLYTGAGLKNFKRIHTLIPSSTDGDTTHVEVYLKESNEFLIVEPFAR